MITVINLLGFDVVGVRCDGRTFFVQKKYNRIYTVILTLIIKRIPSYG